MYMSLVSSTYTVPGPPCKEPSPAPPNTEYVPRNSSSFVMYTAIRPPAPLPPKDEPCLLPSPPTAVTLP